MLIVLVLLATVLLRVALVGLAVYLLLPRGQICRRCETPMLRLRAPVLDTLLPLLELRWCLGCGWKGVARRAPVPRAAAAARSLLPVPPTAE